MKEEWRDVKDYEGIYQVSNMGKVRSLDRLDARGYRRKGKIMKLTANINGYQEIKLSNNNIEKSYKVHRLVAIAFILNPNNLPEVNHKDENKHNNKTENLEFCTRTYNVNYGTRIEKMVKNIDYVVKVKNTDYRTIANKRKKPIVGTNITTGKKFCFDSATDAAIELGCCRENISNCCCGRGKTVGNLLGSMQ